MPRSDFVSSQFVNRQRVQQRGIRIQRLQLLRDELRVRVSRIDAMMEGCSVGRLNHEGTEGRLMEMHHATWARLHDVRAQLEELEAALRIAE